jgi:hypothetical protein
MTAWESLGRVAPETLVGPRQQLHVAVQAVAAIGATYVEAASDYSHISAEWLAARALLVGAPTSTQRSIRLALDPAGLALELQDGKHTTLGRLDLHGHTMADAYTWLTALLAEHLGADERELERPDPPVPPSAPGLGVTPFALEPSKAFEELARWYADADLLLSALRESETAATPVRCWPHHFDIAFLIHLDFDLPAETRRSIGVGMTPGDESYREPYWYVAPWPHPDNPTLPALEGGGVWHTSGWTGAVLLGSDLAKGSAEAQRQQVEDFARSATAACRGLLGG